MNYEYKIQVIKLISLCIKHIFRALNIIKSFKTEH